MRVLKVTLYQTIARTFTIEVPESEPGSEEEMNALRSFLQDAPPGPFDVLADDCADLEEDTPDGTVKRCISLSGPSAYREID